MEMCALSTATQRVTVAECGKCGWIMYIGKQWNQYGRAKTTVRYV